VLCGEILGFGNFTTKFDCAAKTSPMAMKKEGLGNPAVNSLPSLIFIIDTDFTDLFLRVRRIKIKKSVIVLL